MNTPAGMVHADRIRGACIPTEWCMVAALVVHNM